MAELTQCTYCARSCCLAESILTPAELHEEPTVIHRVAIGLDGGGDADRCSTENDRMIRVHPSSLEACTTSRLEVPGRDHALLLLFSLIYRERVGVRGVSGTMSYLPGVSLLHTGEEWT